MEFKTNDWIRTYSGDRFYFKDPKMGTRAIDDIAHALSNLCRYSGHVSRFYSVAEHSVYVSQIVESKSKDPMDAYWGLMHDASEAYLTDLPTPLKRMLPDYIEMEIRTMEEITKTFGLDPLMPQVVKQADHICLANEIRDLMGNPTDWTHVHQPHEGLVIEAVSPERAKAMFLARFKELRERL